MTNILTSISLEKTVQSSLQPDVKKSRKKKRHSTAKLTFKAVKQYIESFEGYQLISTTYKNNSTNLDIVCPVGHTIKMTYESFQRGIRCRECSGRKEQKRQTEPKGYGYIRERYKRQEEQKELKRQSKHTLEKSVQASLQLDKNRHSSTKITIEFVKQYIESFEGYKLTSIEYVNSSTKLDILCPNQHPYKAPYGSFLRGHRCLECSHLSKRRTMPNGEDWEPNEERNSKDNAAWTRAVKKRDCKCQACHSSKNLCAHHIESYSKNPELRTELSNGVTLCRSCHTAIHSRYGKVTATRANLKEFIRSKRSRL